MSSPVVAATRTLSLGMTDDLTRWRLHFNSRGAVNGRGMEHAAVAPGCPAEYHRRDDCECRAFETAFEARMFIRDSNRALEAENHLPDAS